MEVLVKWRGGENGITFQNVEKLSVIPNAVVLENVNGAIIALVPFAQGSVIVPEHDTQIVAPQLHVPGMER